MCAVAFQKAHIIIIVIIIIIITWCEQDVELEHWVLGLLLGVVPRITREFLMINGVINVELGQWVLGLRLGLCLGILGIALNMYAAFATYHS